MLKSQLAKLAVTQQHALAGGVQQRGAAAAGTGAALQQDLLGLWDVCIAEDVADWHV